MMYNLPQPTDPKIAIYFQEVQPEAAIVTLAAKEPDLLIQFFEQALNDRSWTVQHPQLINRIVKLLESNSIERKFDLNQIIRIENAAEAINYLVTINSAFVPCPLLTETMQVQCTQSNIDPYDIGANRLRAASPFFSHLLQQNAFKEIQRRTLSLEESKELALAIKEFLENGTVSQSTIDAISTSLDKESSRFFEALKRLEMQELTLILLRECPNHALNFLDVAYHTKDEKLRDWCYRIINKELKTDFTAQDWKNVSCGNGKIASNEALIEVLNLINDLGLVLSLNQEFDGIKVEKKNNSLSMEIQKSINPESDDFKLCKSFLQNFKLSTLPIDLRLSAPLHEKELIPILNLFDVTNLQSLSMKIRQENFALLAYVIEQNLKITSIDFQMRVTDEIIEGFVQKVPELKQLILSDCFITKETTFQLLNQHCKKLTTLRIDQFDTDYTNDHIQDSYEDMREKEIVVSSLLFGAFDLSWPNLTEIYFLDKNPMFVYSNDLAKIAENCANLKRIEMPHVSSSGIVTFLEHATRLEHFYFGNFSIFGPAFDKKSFDTIRSLSIASYPSETVGTLFNACPNLRSITFEVHNGIKDEMIETVIGYCPNLQEVCFPVDAVLSPKSLEKLSKYVIHFAKQKNND